MGIVYLSGAWRPEMARTGIGHMATPAQGSAHTTPAGVVWAADTGCFANPGAFSLPAYLDWLAARDEHRKGCLFATAPDVVGNAAATLERSLPVLPLLREAGYRAALVAQDGLERMPVPWDDLDCLFVGGTTEWKLSEVAYRLVAEARERGKWTHMGRVNSLRRLRAAALSGYDSADGTYLKYAPDTNLPRLRGWLAQLDAQPALGLAL